MSNEVVLFGGSKLPAFARNREPSEIAKNLMGSAQGSDRISIEAGVFRLVIGGKEVAQIEERYLDVVIVKAAPKVNRVFYAGKYEKGQNQGPACWSADGDTPSADAAQPQSATCATCDKNIKGSGEGDSRACRYQQRIAVVLANGKSVEDEEGSPTFNHGGHGVLQLTVPAGSLFGKPEGENRPLQEYARYVVAQKADPSMLVTRLRFDTAASAPKLFFKPMRWLTDSEFSSVEEMAASAEAEKAVEVSFSKGERLDSEVGGERPKSKAKPAPAADDDDEDDAPAPKAKAKPAPAADDDEDDAPAPKAKAKPAPAADDDEAEPPAKRAPAGKATEGVKKDAASLVDEWDD